MSLGAQTMPLAAPGASGRHCGIDAVTLLSCYLFGLFAIPSALVVGTFGAAGPPATLFAALTLCWYLIARQHHGFAIDTRRQPVRAALLIFCCATLASYISANRSAMSTLESNGADRGLTLLAGWLGVALLAADGIHRADRLAVLIRRIVLGASVMAVLGIAEFATGIDVTRYLTIPGLTVHEQVTNLMVRNGLFRVNATASQPLEFSSVLAMCLPLAILQARHAGRGRGWRWLQAALIAGTIPMGVSRSAILGLLATALILIPTWPPRERRHAYVVAAIFPVVIWLTEPGMLRSLVTTFGQLGSDSSSSSRSSALASAVPMIASHPWLGQGFQTFFPQTYFFVDDQFITSLIETGAIGLLAVLGLLACGWLVAGNTRQTASDAWTRDLAQTLKAVMAVAVISFTTFDVLSFPMTAGLFFLLLGCAGAAWRQARP